MIKPWLLRYRKRLLLCGVVAIFLAVSVLFWTTAESFTDFGVLWHHFCGCPLDPDDTRVLLNAPGLIAVILGFLIGFPNPGSPGTVSLTPYRAETAYFLTRPIRRTTVLLIPFLLAAFTVVVFPAAALLVLYAWLHAVHAPSLDHIIGLLQLVPASAALGAHPGFFRLLLADSFPQRYLAAVSAGLCMAVLLASTRWFTQSPSPRVKLLGSFPLFFVLFPVLGFLNKGLLVWIMAISTSNLTPPPSWMNISLHLAVAFALVYGCWRILRTLEL
jgi:hypothetical protein